MLSIDLIYAQYYTSTISHAIKLICVIIFMKTINHLGSLYSVFHTRYIHKNVAIFSCSNTGFREEIRKDHVRQFIYY